MMWFALLVAVAGIAVAILLVLVIQYFLDIYLPPRD